MVDNQPRTLQLTKVLDDDLKQLVFELVEREQDILIVFDGEEGSGKSHTLRQIGWVLTHHLKEMFGICNDFSSANIHYAVADYLKSMWDNEDKRGWINALDEGGDEIDKQSTISPSGKRYIRALRRARKLCQIHLVAMPAAHDLTKYIALWRLKFIIKMTKERVESKTSPTGKDLKLGHFRVIRNDQRWKYCYMDKTPYKYPNFLTQNKTQKSKDGDFVKYKKDHKGKFIYCEVFPKNELDALKQKNLEFAKELDLKEDKKKAISKAQLAIQYKAKYPDMTQAEIARKVGCTRQTVHDALGSIKV